jgi:enoyl-CoA hydratase
MAFDTLLLETDADGIAVVTVNRPDKLNALNASVLDDLDACFAALTTDDAVRGILLTGAGDRSFVAGADIAQFADLDTPGAAAFARRGQAVFDRIERCPKPVVAVIGGFALGGGCELALACHLRVASTTARLGQPEVGLGLIPGYGGTQRLPRVVGRGLAVEMILTGAPVTADRAYAIGLVNRVFEPDVLMAEARAFLATILRQAPVAVSLALEAIRASDQPQPDGMAREAALFGRAFATEDVREGVRAFLERRKPSFTGR